MPNFFDLGLSVSEAFAIIVLCLFAMQHMFNWAIAGWLQVCNYEDNIRFGLIGAPFLMMAIIIGEAIYFILETFNCVNTSTW